MEGVLRLFKKATDMYYDIKQGFQNMKYWFTSIWQDRDWEPANMYLIIIKKLDKMIKYFESDQCMCKYPKKEIRKMMICKNALERLHGKNSVSVFSYIRVIYRYNSIPVDNYTDDDLFYDTMSTCVSEGLLKDLAIARTPSTLQTNFSRKKYKEIYDRCNEHEEYMEKQAMEYFTKYFKYSNRWWD